MELVPPMESVKIKGVPEFSGLALASEEGVPTLFDGSQLRRIKSYVRCGLQLPAGLFPSLAVMDAACGTSAHRFLFELKTHCGQWAALERALLKAVEELSAFGVPFSKFCSETSAQIRALPILRQCANPDARGGVGRGVLKAAASLRRQAEMRERASKRLLGELERFQTTMDETIVPQSGAVCGALGQLEPLVLDVRGYRVTVEHCGFLADDPVVKGFVRDLEHAGSEDALRRVRESLELTAKPIWEGLLHAFSRLDETGAAVAGAVAGGRNLNVLWAAILRYLESVIDELEHAGDAKRLVLLANGLGACADFWGGLAGYGRQLGDALRQA